MCRLARRVRVCACVSGCVCVCACARTFLYQVCVCDQMHSSAPDPPNEFAQLAHFSERRDDQLHTHTHNSMCANTAICGGSPGPPSRPHPLPACCRSFNRAQLCLATFCQLAFLALEVMCASSMLWRHLPLLVLGLPTLLHMAINRWASEPAGAGERAAGAPEAGGAPQVEAAPPWAEQQQEATAQARKSHAAGLTADAGVGPWPWASSAACAHSGGGGRGTDACVASATSALPGSSFIMESTGSSSRPAFNQWTPPPAKQAAALVLQPPAALPASPAVAAGEAAGVGLVVVNKGDLSGMAQAGPSIFFGGRSFSVSQRGVPTSPSPQNDAAALQALLSAMEREGNMRVGDD